MSNNIRKVSLIKLFAMSQTKFGISSSTSSLRGLTNGTADLLVNSAEARSLTADDATFENLIVTNTAIINTLISDINIEDSLIVLSKNNPADNFTSGLLIEYQSGGTKNAGIVRSHTDKAVYLLNGVTAPIAETDNITTAATFPRSDLVCKDITAEALNLQAVGADGCVVDAYGHNGTLDSPTDTASGDTLLNIQSYGRENIVGKLAGCGIKIIAGSNWNGDNEANMVISASGNTRSTFNKMKIEWDKITFNPLGTGEFSLPETAGTSGYQLTFGASNTTSWQPSGGSTPTIQTVYTASADPQIVTTTADPTFVIESGSANPLLFQVNNGNSTPMVQIDETGILTQHGTTYQTSDPFTPLDKWEVAVDGSSNLDFLSTGGSSVLNISTSAISMYGGQTTITGDRIDNTEMHTDGLYLKDGATERWVIESVAGVLHTSTASGDLIRTIAQDGTLEHFNSSGDKCFQVDSSCRFGITSKATLSEDLEVHGNDGNCSVVIGEHGTNASGPLLKYEKSRGTELVPAVILSGDSLGGLEAYGYNGASYAWAGEFIFRATENFDNSPARRGIEFNLATVANGVGGNPIDRFGINSSGQVFHGANAYTFPITDGTADQLLTTDGAGALTFTSTLDMTQISAFDIYLKESADATRWRIEASDITAENVMHIHNEADAVVSTQFESGQKIQYVGGVAKTEIRASGAFEVHDDFMYDKGCAEYYVVANVTGTTTTVAGTWYPVSFSDASSNSGQAVGFTVDVAAPNAGRITYNGSRDRICHAGVTVSFESDTNNVLVEFEVYINGVAYHGSHVKMFYGNGVGKFQSTAMHLMPTLSASDYIELHVSSDSAGAVITIEECNVFVLALPNEV